jgi:CO/xanthine dehydrogenase Mo-binding subunit
VARAPRRPGRARSGGLAVARRADPGLTGGGACACSTTAVRARRGSSAAGSADERLYCRHRRGDPGRRLACACAAPDTDSAYLTGDAPASSAAGRAVELAATLARDRIREAGAALLGVPAAQAALAEGRVGDGSERSVSFAEIGASALRAGEPLSVTATPTQTRVPHSLAVAAADVEVDVETGGVEVLRLSAVVAGGPFEDARQAAAQVEGALVSALEQALVSGRPPLAAASDVPPLAVTFVPGGDPLSRFGTAAHAEAAARAALAALANAIARASATRPRSLPLDPARLLEAITEAQARSGSATR